MTSIEHLSNKELVDELMRYTPQVAQCISCEELSEEILRRLNEPWRVMKENIESNIESIENERLSKNLAEFKKDYDDELEDMMNP